MSSSADDVVSTTTGMWHRSLSDLIFSSSCLPSYFGQVQVEQDQVRPRGALVGTALVKEVQALLTVVRDVKVVVDLVVLERFPRDELVAGIVLDQQDVDRASS